MMLPRIEINSSYGCFHEHERESQMIVWLFSLNSRSLRSTSLCFDVCLSTRGNRADAEILHRTPSKTAGLGYFGVQ